MEEYDIWVLGTPVYYWGPSAQFKAFLDRWFGAGKYVKFKGKDAILAIPLGSSNEYDAHHTVGMLEDSLNYVKVNLLATLLAAGAYEAGEIREQKHLLKKAKQAGIDMVIKRG
ncbi:MAG: flavodoxin family protein [Candidatus Heimdallarchaeota archaeon]|nr:flavodoxin family protein [Candidatus Heimdallarchaeota archaeon]